MYHTRALAIFDRTPARNELPASIHPLSVSQYRALHQSLLCDSIERFSNIENQSLLLFLREEEQEESIHERFPALDVRIQSGETTGERLYHMFEDSFDEGYKHVLLVNSNVPSIPLRIPESAYTLLDAFDDSMVIAPTQRGGFYALGLRHLIIELFSGLDFASERLYDNTLSNVPDDTCSLYILPTWEEMITASDLKRWYEKMQQFEEDQTVLKHTAAFFDQLKKQSFPFDTL